MNLNKKKYNKPISEVVVRVKYFLLSNSSGGIPKKKQCDCSQHRLWGGCDGCPGDCPCGEC